MESPTERQEKLTALLANTAETAAGCMEWKGAVGARGYGFARYRGRTREAHRVVMLCITGSIPPGMYVCHHCDNKRCINPAHLYIGTPSDNTNDAWRRGRVPRQRSEQHRSKTAAAARARTAGYYARGEGCYLARLSVSEVLEIRQAPGSNQEIGRAFGVSISTVSRIRRRVAWAWLQDPAPPATSEPSPTPQGAPHG